MAEPVIIVDYDANWPSVFERLRLKIAAALGSIAVAVEHVGSTAVEGLAAKPIIDIDVLLDSECNLVSAIEKLKSIGYGHQGNLGIAGREAFLAPPGSPPHHLYVCQPGSEEFSRHVAFRDFLRTHPAAAREYGALKRELSVRCRHNRKAYTEGKGNFVLKILPLAHPSQGIGR